MTPRRGNRTWLSSSFSSSANLVQTSVVARPASVSHYNVQPMINVYASVSGRDLGSVAGEVTKRVNEISKQLPRGSRIVIRGMRAATAPHKEIACEQYHRVERGHGSFSRAFALPEPINVNAITADLKETMR